MRRAMRRLSQHYDDALRPFNLKLSQYSVLANLARRPGSTITDLAGLLDMDRTTLTRNLGPLQRRGLVAIRTGTDTRIREVSLTEEGGRLLDAAMPSWRSAEDAIRTQLGKQDVGSLHALLDQVLTETKTLEGPL